MIDHGHVKELGTHEQLLALKGTYAELVALQGGVASPGPSHATAAGEAEEAAKKKKKAEEEEKESKIKAAQSNIGVSLSRRLSRALSMRRAPQTDGEKRPSLWALSFRHWPYLAVGILANCALGVLFPFWVRACAWESIDLGATVRRCMAEASDRLMLRSQQPSVHHPQ